MTGLQTQHPILSKLSFNAVKLLLQDQTIFALKSSANVKNLLSAHGGHQSVVQAQLLPRADYPFFETVYLDNTQTFYIVLQGEILY